MCSMMGENIMELNSRGFIIVAHLLLHQLKDNIDGQPEPCLWAMVASFWYLREIETIK